MWKLHASPLAAAIALSIAALATGAQAVHQQQTSEAACAGASLLGATGCQSLPGGLLFGADRARA